jgi:hypothetical protein
VTSPNALTAVLPPGLPPGVYNIVVTNPGFPPSAPPLTITFPFPPPPPPNPGIEGVLHVPVVVNRPPFDTTAIFVQNVSPTGTNVTVRYFDFNGATQPQWTRTQSIAPGESTIFDAATDPTVPLGFDGSAVLDSPQPITAVVNRLITLDPGGFGPQEAPPPDELAFASGRSSAGSFTVSSGFPATQSTVPVVFGGYHGYFTTLSVQNTGPAPGNYTIAFSRTGFPGAISTIQRPIPPNASARIRVGPEAGVPPDFVGTAIVTAGGSTVTVAAETIHIETGVYLSYSGSPTGTPTGIPTGISTVNTPLLFKHYNGWLSGAQVVNVSPAPVVVNATIIQRDSPIPFQLAPRPLAPNESVTYYLPAIEPLPDGFVGSGVFTANGPISVVVQQINDEQGAAMAYAGFGSGSPRVSIPVIFKDWNSWDSGVQVQNLGQSDAFVIATYHLPGGFSFNDTGLIAARGSTTFYQGDHPGLPPNAIGAMTINSGGGQPIVAIVNQVNYSRSGDSTMAYEGINY